MSLGLLLAGYLDQLRLRDEDRQMMGVRTRPNCKIVDLSHSLEIARIKVNFARLRQRSLQALGKRRRCRQNSGDVVCEQHGGRKLRDQYKLYVK